MTAQTTARNGTWVAPMVVGAGALAACATLAVVDPSPPGRYGYCPFLAVTGQWCPFCGSLRAVHHLTNGSVATAAGFNLLTVAAVPLAVWLWVVWVGDRTGRWRLARPAWGPAQVRVAIAVTVLFGVLRNLAAFSALAP